MTRKRVLQVLVSIAVVVLLVMVWVERAEHYYAMPDRSVAMSADAIKSAAFLLEKWHQKAGIYPHAHTTESLLDALPEALSSMSMRLFTFMKDNAFDTVFQALHRRRREVAH